MIIREYKTSDCAEMAKLFYDTVHKINAKDYTKEQLNAWATGSVDLEKWDKSFLQHYSLVAVENGHIIGFGDIDKAGYLDRLYVHKDFQNRKVATKLCDMLEKSVKADFIEVHASITAKSFFEHRGYIVVKQQQVERNKVFLTNYVMKKCFK